MMLAKFQEVFEEYRENAVYLFEYANVLDFMGKETSAIPLHQTTIGLGLSGIMKTQAEIQMGSSMSVTGKNESAVDILRRMYKENDEPAALMFLCIALFRYGELEKSLKTPLSFIISGNHGLLSEYQRALSQYLNEIE